MKQREDGHYQMICSRELLPCVPLCFLSSYGNLLCNVLVFFFLSYKKVDYETKCFSSTPHIISTRTKKQCATLINDRE